LGALEMAEPDATDGDLFEGVVGKRVTGLEVVKIPGDGLFDFLSRFRVVIESGVVGAEPMPERILCGNCFAFRSTRSSGFQSVSAIRLTLFFGRHWWNPFVRVCQEGPVLWGEASERGPQQPLEG
jgi:hypothetical protein